MGIESLKILPASDWGRIRDIYIPIAQTDGAGIAVSEGCLDQGIAYIGGTEPYRLWDGSSDEVAHRLIGLMVDLSRGNKARITMDGVGSFRAQYVRTNLGQTLALRVLPDVTPTLQQLNMPQVCRDLLLDPQLLQGGLVLIPSTNGQGKTTTASATVKSRLQLYQGHCNTVEDPPECPLEGYHGQGRCFQIPAEPDDSGLPGSGYAKALLDTLRFFPGLTGGGTVLFIGEIRDARTALEAILAAANGHLVLATIHGNSIRASLQRLSTLAQATPDHMPASQVNMLLAETLKLVHYQTLQYNIGAGPTESRDRWSEGRLSCKVLAVAPGDKATIDLIAAGDFARLDNVISNQDAILSDLEEEIRRGTLATGVAAAFRKRIITK
jgi:Tfp pilus assembly pilus retraction ATPase PilT